MVLSRTTHSIGNVAIITGVSKRQLRSWEAKGYIPETQRIVCGERSYRRYDFEQIEMIKRIKKYLDEGFTLKAAVEKAKAEDRKAA